MFINEIEIIPLPIGESDSIPSNRTDVKQMETQH